MGFLAHKESSHSSLEYLVLAIADFLKARRIDYEDVLDRWEALIEDMEDNF